MVLSIKQHSLFQLINSHLIEYPTPSNLTLFWNYGFLAAMCLVTQLLSGIALAMHFTPHVDLAFLSVEHIMRDVNGGWLIRYIHANGASMFFITVYIHIARGLYYGSYMQPRGLVWTLGVIILILMMATAFMGYVLVWGQMSFWAATVITNFFTAFPIVGNKIVTLLWGGFSVDNATLNRFFSLHYLLPFLIAGVVVVHMAAVHNDGSNNPLGISSHADKISFFPYFFIKDTLGLVGGLIFFSFFVYYSPNSLGHSDNYIPANPMSTPEHIVPEWYFLFAYAILRSIPNKLMGVLALFASLLVLLLLPLINTSAVRSSLYRPLYQKFFWFLVADFFLLSYLGQAPAESPYIEVGQFATIYYFGFFILLVPILGRLEKTLVYSI
jgi:quinol-cytochrome oxidoreductase complex cytochrome b subunit|uniref:Cytochrome b n=1 Tax=Phaeocystis globosa TaxID=33658 RepID=A0A8A1RXH6_9EUKA|nr:apocytochrome b [Phaeocystis globosa]QST19755.1 apocytochrome b [Phaeocystis globosa]QST19774.1 apocytochrome b [Phaeocystis globosa]QST19793.1 apocytochrome b [Phaeocystis globosa]QST19812.1 apocytochrome b [Phaeocystis globosa]